MFETSVSHVSHGEFTLQIETKESMQSGNRCWTEMEREDREGSVTSVAESMPKKSRRNSIRGLSLQTYRKFYSDERDLREDLERRAQQAVLGENSAQRKLYLTESDMEIQKFGAKKFRRRIIRVTTRA